MTRGALGAAALTAAALLATTSLDRPSPGRAAALSNTVRFDGEYGLSVRFEGDSVRVGWITAPASAGALEVLSRGRVHFETTTPADSAHAAVFRNPGRDTMVLRYGALGGAGRHSTTIDLRTGRRRDPVSFPAADSVYVMGDIHGEFDTLVRVLRNAGLIDQDLRWAGGRAHLVVVGDMTDRGADVTRVLWFLYRLERQAAAADGRLHVVLGNHEFMVMLDDLRYVAAKEQTIARLHGVGYDRLFDPRVSVLGRWLASKPVLIRIGDVLFAHGGVSPAYLGHTLESVADSLAAFVAEDLFYRWADTTFVVTLDSAALARRSDFFWDESSILWYRGYVQADTLAGPLQAVLDRFRASLLVVGHTPGEGIRERYGGTLIATNTLPFAKELLLLVRTRAGWERFRISGEGPPVPLPE